MHPKGANSMAVSGLRHRKVPVGSGSAISVLCTSFTRRVQGDLRMRLHLWVHACLLALPPSPLQLSIAFLASYLTFEGQICG